MNECGCRKCLRKLDKTNPEFLFSDLLIPREFTVMALCEICGNKRCPHATDHELECTGSNEPGQKGSYYEDCPNFSIGQGE